MTAHRWYLGALGLVLAAVVPLAAVPLLRSAPQQVPGLPTPGSAAVQVVNQPTVQAVQTGEWRVTVPGTVAVALARGTALAAETPDFLEAGHRYIIRWGTGLTGTYTVVQASRGWALVRSGNSRLWVNAAMAVEIEEAR
jgi:hypothetical protein